MMRACRSVGLIAAALALGACAPTGAGGESGQALGISEAGLQQVPLTIASGGKTHNFVVEVASTPEQQQRGLMHRQALAPDRGMIFPYDTPQPASFWMRNTVIPLDIIFIRADGTISAIVTAVPLDETPVQAIEPAAAVLEIPGGRAAELGIQPEDKVSWTKP
jgi:uncharacterized membrane protein (UPF0127 family)